MGESLKFDISGLRIINWPDPRLTRRNALVERFDAPLRELAARMFELMREHRGVGLAAPQVGVNIRLFVMNATGEPDGDRIYANPTLSEPDGNDEAEEGCLSLPGLNVNIVRNTGIRLQAFAVDGKPVDEIASGFVARVWQHEIDHLNGILLLDRMGAVAKMTNRRLLREMEAKYAELNPPPKPKPARKRR